MLGRFCTADGAFLRENGRIKASQADEQGYSGKGCMKAFDAGKLLISVKEYKITGNTALQRASEPLIIFKWRWLAILM